MGAVKKSEVCGVMLCGLLLILTARTAAAQSQAALKGQWPLDGPAGVELPDSPSAISGTVGLWHFNEGELPGNGKVFYSLSGDTTPRTRDYNGTDNSFAAAVSTVAGGTAIQSVMKASPINNEMVAGYVDAAGLLRVMCYNGAAWTNEWSVTVGGTGTTRRFDIAYESNSGDVIVLYSANVATTNELRFRTKLGSARCGSVSWSAETNLDPVRTSGVVHWVKLAMDRRSSSNLIAAIWADSGADLSAMIWDGTAWGNEPGTALEISLEVVFTPQDVEDFDVEYESLSGDVMVVWANSAGADGTNGVRYATCTGGTSTCTWSGVTTPPTWLDDATHLDIASNPNTDEIVFASIGNAGNDLQAGYWSGSAWTNTANLDTSAQFPDAGRRFVATGWLIAGATTRSIITYYDSGATNIGWVVGNIGVFTLQTDFTPLPGFGTQTQYEIEMDPVNKDRLMLVVSNSISDISAKRLVMTSTPAFTWTDADGPSAVGETCTNNGVTCNTASATYKTFDFVYSNPTATTAADSSGNNNSGTYNGGVIQTTAGKFAHALSFDGSNDYVIMNPFTSFPTTEITAEFWMNSSDTTKNGTPISYAVSGSDNEFLIYNYNNFAIYRGASLITTGISANDGQWHHIAVTWRSSDGQTQLYKDSVLSFTGTLAAGTTITGGGSLVIGQEQDSVGGGFDVTQAFLGLMDEVAIYNRALSSTEILDHYQRGVARDASGNNQHGQITGPVSATGQVGQALSFDGADDVVGEVSTFLNQVLSTFTMEAWFNTTVGGTIFAIDTISAPGDTTDGGTAIGIWGGTGLAGGRVQKNEGVPFADLLSSLTYKDGAWHHLALTYDGANGTLYVDGSPVAGPTNLGITLDEATTRFGIGVGFGSAMGRFNGLIDQAAIYNVTLDGCEVQDHLSGVYITPDGMIDGRGDNLYGAVGTGAGGESARTVTTAGMTLSYALTVQNRAGTQSPIKLVWTLPASWTGAVGGGQALIQELTATCAGSPVTCTATTPSLVPGSPAVYTLNVTPPASETVTREIIVNLQSTNPTCVSPKIVDSVKAIAMDPDDLTQVNPPTDLVVAYPEANGDDVGDDDSICETGENCKELLGDGLGDEDGICEAGETCVGERQLLLAFTDSSNNETGFEVERITTVAAAVCSSLTGYSRIATILRDGSQSTQTGATIYYNSTGLTPATYYCYRVRGFNSSGYSDYSYPSTPPNIAMQTLPPAAGDVTAPVDITDLEIVEGGQTGTSIQLAWTAPGDDGTTGQASFYDLRYARLPILNAGAVPGTSVNYGTNCTNTTASTLNATRPTDCAVLVMNLQPPQAAGATEYRTVTGRLNAIGQCDVALSDATRPVCLTPNIIHYFALKTADERGFPAGESNLSNNAYCSGTASACGDNTTDGDSSGRTALRAGYNLVSVPMNPIAANPGAVFGDDAATLELFRWDSTGPLSTDGVFIPYAYTNFVTNSDTVALWHLDEGAGTATTDVSGYGNNGSLGGSPQTPIWDTTNKKFGNSALFFDDVDDMVFNGSAFLNSVLSSFTMEAWFKTGIASATGTIFSITAPSGFGGSAVGLSSGNAVGRIQQNGSTIGFGDVTSAGTYADNQWHHIALTYNGTTRTGILYMDGASVGTLTTVSSLNQVTDAFRIGTGLGNAFGAFGGYIDEVAIWNRPLSAVEIAAHAQAASAFSETQPIQPGEGYFLRAGDPTGVIDVPAGSTAVTAVPNCGVANSYQVPVDPQGGWNIIGNPFPKPVNLTDVQVCRSGVNQLWDTAAGSGWVGAAIYHFNGSNYQALTTTDTLPARFEPWQAYWVEVLDPSVTHLVFPQPP
jgi:hypothetical protein